MLKTITLGGIVLLLALDQSARRPALRAADDSPKAQPSKVGDLQKERLGVLQELLAEAEKAHKSGATAPAQLHKAKIAVLNAELELCTADADRVGTLEKIVAEAKKYEEGVTESARGGASTNSSALNAKLARVEAEIALERAKAKLTPKK